MTLTDFFSPPLVQGFQSFPRLGCRFTWCLDFRDEPTCKTARFLSAHFISNTTIGCTTDSYIPLDIDCSQLVSMAVCRACRLF